MGSTLQDGARNQVLFREVNRRIAELSGDAKDTGVRLLLCCECIDRACAESLEITRVEYERVRAHDAHFIVLPGHEQAEVEHVVDRCARFVVVQTDGSSDSDAGYRRGR